MPYKNHKKHLEHCRQYYLDNKAASRRRGRKYAAVKRVRITKILQELKVNGCAICGYNKSPVALDFHHANPKDKKFLLNAANLSRADYLIVEELNKCVLVCANCHRLLHYAEKEQIEDEN